VQAYIAAIPGWKREVGRRLDALSDVATLAPASLLELEIVFLTCRIESGF
jgi:hypothetical protein